MWLGWQTAVYLYHWTFFLIFNQLSTVSPSTTPDSYMVHMKQEFYRRKRRITTGGMHTVRLGDASARPDVVFAQFGKGGLDEEEYLTDDEQLDVLPGYPHSFFCATLLMIVTRCCSSVHEMMHVTVTWWWHNFTRWCVGVSPDGTSTMCCLFLWPDDALISPNDVRFYCCVTSLRSLNVFS